ncbi:MAG: biotin--[acetyl-CoA-carboxylase] ligase [Steroidobacteraceae bacterium]|nr:biotin--[acetyl-CoA-carboxylase] ligase [Steroidobacteraceae bacterium]
MTRRTDVLRLLSDGAVHSGESLAAALGVSRAAVWKQVQQLDAWGLEVEAVPGRGYRLAQRLDLLDEAALRSALPEAAVARLRTLTVADEIESTNEALLAAPALPPGRMDACLAEFQTRGRGRRGRSWVAPFASGLCLSLSWTFRETPPQFSALSLAVGVGVLRALRTLGVAGVGLKWPNDLLHELRKLGGILIELRAEAAGPAFAVIGLGLNVTLPEAARAQVAASGLAVASLDDFCAVTPSRTQLAAAVIGELERVLTEFEVRGFAPFADEWRAADALAARPAFVVQGESRVDGLARGIDEDGALLLEVAGCNRRFVSGEVSLRPVA